MLYRRRSYPVPEYPRLSVNIELPGAVDKTAFTLEEWDAIQSYEPSLLSFEGVKALNLYYFVKLYVLLPLPCSLNKPLPVTLDIISSSFR